MASRTPSHASSRAGGRKRRGPTGGAANGMPRNTRTPSRSTPSTLPLRVSMQWRHVSCSELAEVRFALLEERSERLEVGRRADDAGERLVFTRARGADGVETAGEHEPLRLDERGHGHRRDAVGEVHRLGQQRVGLDRAERQTRGNRGVGGDPLAGVERDRGPLAAHHRRHQQAARSLGHDTERHERRAQACTLGDQHGVAVQQHGEADADAEPVDRGEQRFLERRNGVDEAGNPGPGSSARPAAVGSIPAISPRSWPAENARPVPVNTTHAMSSRALASWNACAHAS